MEKVNYLFIDRKYCFKNINDPFVNIQVHGFSDGSNKAYGCCIYLRFEHTSGLVKTTLVTAKSRINSVAGKTTPRLELQGALLLSRCTNSVLENLSSVYDINQVTWVDSTIVFCWIQNEHKCIKSLYERN